MSSPWTPTDIGTAPRRRNGRQQACEPCRKRKVACDHRMPVCSRCQSSDMSNACIYEAQTIPKPSKKTSASKAPTQQPRQPRQPILGATTPGPLTPPSNEEGYLGITSYRYAMREAQSRMAPMQPSEEFTEQTDASHSCMSMPRMMGDERTYEAAMRVLRAVPTRNQAYDFFKAHRNPNDGWCRLALNWLHDSLWDTLGAHLDGDRSTKSLLQLATKLCDNSCTPLFEDYTDPKDWFESFSGPNMRWEGLGILFTHWSFGAMAFRQGPECSKYSLGDYTTHILDYKSCAWDCVEITRKTASANTLLLCLMYRQFCLESIVSGDDSILHVRIRGETIALVTYLGLHATEGEMFDKGICTQIKRRLFGKIFHGDKVDSTFVGWPPMLSQRFISTPLPLDVSDEVLMGLTPWRDDIVDEDGWNTLGAIYPSTLLRARAYIGFIRDSILNISLQAGGCINREELLNLRTKQRNTRAKFPPCLAFELDDVDDRDVRGPELYATLLIQLEYLQNMFFIERLLNKVDNVTLSAALIQVSLKIVSTTLIVWTHKDRMTGLHDDFEWLAIGYAAPAAGILCLELLRPNTGEKMDAATSAVTTDVSRSELIQNLSLFHGFLRWIKPFMPSKERTCFVRNVIRRVLDQVLAPPSHAVELPGVDFISWGAEMGIEANDFSLDLLDTFDWMRPIESDIVGADVEHNT